MMMGVIYQNTLMEHVPSFGQFDVEECWDSVEKFHK